MIKVLVMSLEFDYNDLFDKLEGPNANPVVGRLLFIFFMVLVPIVLMNLLIGLAVSDISALEKRGHAQQLAKQIDFLSMLEVFVCSRILTACCPKQLSKAIKWCGAPEKDLEVQPGKPYAVTCRSLPLKLREAVIYNITNTIDGKEKQEKENEEKLFIETKSISSVAKSEKPPEATTAGNLQLKNSLECIMKELKSIQEELKDIKMKRL